MGADKTVEERDEVLVQDKDEVLGADKTVGDEGVDKMGVGQAYSLVDEEGGGRQEPLDEEVGELVLEVQILVREEFLRGDWGIHGTG